MLAGVLYEYDWAVVFTWLGSSKAPPPSQALSSHDCTHACAQHGMRIVLHPTTRSMRYRLVRMNARMHGPVCGTAWYPCPHNSCVCVRHRSVRTHARERVPRLLCGFIVYPISLPCDTVQYALHACMLLRAVPLGTHVCLPQSILHAG